MFRSVPVVGEDPSGPVGLAVGGVSDEIVGVAFRFLRRLTYFPGPSGG